MGNRPLCHMRTRKVQMSMRFRTFSVQQHILQYPLVLWADNEGPDQPAWMCRLIRACIVQKLHKGPFLVKYVFLLLLWTETFWKAFWNVFLLCECDTVSDLNKLCYYLYKYFVYKFRIVYYCTCYYQPVVLVAVIVDLTLPYFPENSRPAMARISLGP